jgi:hypothetical protein
MDLRLDRSQLAFELRSEEEIGPIDRTPEGICRDRYGCCLQNERGIFADCTSGTNSLSRYVSDQTKRAQTSGSSTGIVRAIY